MDHTNKSWEKFLNPDELKANLISISLFITAFELFKDSVISKPKTFFTDGFSNGVPTISQRYKTDVLSRSKYDSEASLLWFIELGAINDSDLIVYNTIRDYRNNLAHEAMSFITDSKREIDPEMFGLLIELFKKIEKWWVINFELSIDPDSLPEGANPDDVIPGLILSLQLMFDIALGNEPESGYYYNAFKQKST